MKHKGSCAFQSKVLNRVEKESELAPLFWSSYKFLFSNFFIFGTWQNRLEARLWGVPDHKKSSKKDKGSALNLWNSGIPGPLKYGRMDKQRRSKSYVRCCGRWRRFMEFAAAVIKPGFVKSMNESVCSMKWQLGSCGGQLVFNAQGNNILYVESEMRSLSGKSFE